MHTPDPADTEEKMLEGEHMQHLGDGEVADENKKVMRLRHYNGTLDWQFRKPGDLPGRGELSSPGELPTPGDSPISG